jgi:hypothetical protein
MGLSDIASIATLILFIFYFLGRTWTIQKEKILMCESFDFENVEYDGEPEADRENYYDLNGGGEIVSIISQVPILWFHVIAIDYDREFRDVTPLNKKPIVAHEEPIRANCPIYLRTEIPEGFPAFKICFQRFDYAIVTFCMGYNGRFGGMSPVQYKITHTLKSFLYYMLK